MWQIPLSDNKGRGTLYILPSKIIGVVNYEDEFADILLYGDNSVRIHGKTNVSNFMIKYLSYSSVKNV